MFGKKRQPILCNSCERPLKVDQKVCRCGAATRFMDFEERVQYEVQQWRSHQQAATA